MMDASIWACCGLMGAFITYYFISLLLANLYPKSASLFRRYVYNPQICRKLRLGSIRGREYTVNIRGKGVVTPLYLLLATAMLIVNIVVLAVSAKSYGLLIWRSGRVLAFNLCVLIVSGKQSIFSDSLGIGYVFQAFFHRCLGRIVFLVGIFHVTIAIVRYQEEGTIVLLRSNIAGFTAALALFVLVLSSSISIRKISYEIFYYCHNFFAAIIVVASFVHLTPVSFSKPSTILLVITVSMYVLLIGMRTGMFILQKATATIYHGDSLLKVNIVLDRPMRVRPGQHIWLRIPSTSHTSFAESHPFAIASWGKTKDNKTKDDKKPHRFAVASWWKTKDDKKEVEKTYITILVDIKKGFTRRLKMLADFESGNAQSFNAYIDGPYGLPIKAEEFGTVILYATGIGIGAQLATVKYLLERREAGMAKTQRVTLLWEVEEEFFERDQETDQYKEKNDTAVKMVLDLLQQDCDRLSRLRLNPTEKFKYMSGWQGAPPEQGYMFRCTRYVRNPHQRVSPIKNPDNLTSRDSPVKNNDETTSIYSNWSGNTLVVDEGGNTLVADEGGNTLVADEGLYKVKTGNDVIVGHGATASLNTVYSGLDISGSLESQLQHDNCRGRILVSVCAYPELADSIRNIVATKGLHLHEHEFRPERWPRMKTDAGLV